MCRVGFCEEFCDPVGVVISFGHIPGVVVALLLDPGLRSGIPLGFFAFLKLSSLLAVV